MNNLMIIYILIISVPVIIMKMNLQQMELYPTKLRFLTLVKWVNHLINFLILDLKLIKALMTHYYIKKTPLKIREQMFSSFIDTIFTESKSCFFTHYFTGNKSFLGIFIFPGYH